MIKAADMLIARRADTRARADFATWKMLAKLNGASALPTEAQNLLVSYKQLLTQMNEADATGAAIRLLYEGYYKEMGGTGTPPDMEAPSSPKVTDNVTAFKRPPAKRPNAAANGSQAKPRLPVALIFACLVVVYVGIRYLWR